MSTAHDTVHDRVELAIELTPRRVLVALALAAALGFAMLLVTDPTAHAATHDFRHAAGVACH